MRAEAEPQVAGMVDGSVGKLEGEGAEAHQAWLHADSDIGGRQDGPAAYNFDRLD